MQPVCKHPKVRVVAREDDVEYVECEECGEVFDADEYQEMSQDGSSDEVMPRMTTPEPDRASPGVSHGVARFF